MDKLTGNHFSFRCPMNWDDMEISGSGRHCCKCQKQVFDLTNCSIDEVIALQRKHGPICGSIRLAQAAVMAASLSAAACQTTRPQDSPYMLGMIAPPARMGGAIVPPEELKKSDCPPDVKKPVY